MLRRTALCYGVFSASHQGGEVVKALVFEKPYQAVVRDFPDPQAGEGEIVIKVHRAGICGTDLHIYEGDYLSNYPIIPGHEFAGTVAEVGAGVKDFAVGDRVAADPNIFCGSCLYCRTHRANQCSNFAAIGVTRHGAMAEYVAVPARTAVKLPDHLTFQQAAMIEPVACVVYALQRLSVRPGDRAILFGAGAMGQQLVQALRSTGVSELAVVDLSDDKLALAMQYGATHPIHANNLEAVLPAGKRNFDIVVDATGIPKVIEQAISYIGPAGKYLQFGVAPKSATIPLRPFQLFNLDWTLIGSMAIHHSFIPAVQWVATERIAVDPIVTKVIGLQEAAQYFQSARSPRDMKVQIQIDEG